MANNLGSLLSLKGRTALVVGGAGWLGSEISDALAEMGADIIVASRDVEKCRVLSDTLSQAHKVDAHGLFIDITDRDSIAECIDRSRELAGGFDILVMCAWTGRKNSWETMNDEDWDFDIEVSLNGVYRTVKAAFPVLKESKGVILTIGSMYGHVAPDWRLYEDVPQANPPSYGAAKAGIIQFTKYLSSFLGPHGIRANCISPGPFPFPETGEQYPEFIERLSAKNPLGRTGLPHEIKGMAALLCSDAASYITGQNICIDGGWAAW
jgi:NAD(P)-dependent dehydrogenase (short-subunit alcohol dehydrogenase family)